MLIVMMMGMWSDYCACRVVHDVRLYINLVISGEVVYYSVVFGTLVGVSVFIVIWLEMLITSAIRWLL